MRIHSMDERRGVVKMEGTRGGYALGAENGHCELLAKPTVGSDWEEVCRCIYVNHRHSKTSSVYDAGYIHQSAHDSSRTSFGGNNSPFCPRAQMISFSCLSPEIAIIHEENHKSCTRCCCLPNAS